MHNLQAWTTLETVILMPVFVMLISILVGIGSLYKYSIIISFDAYNLAKALAEKAQLEDKVLNDGNCKDYSSDILKEIDSTGHYLYSCSVKDNILTVTLKRGIRMPLNPANLYMDKLLSASGYIYVK